MQKKLQYLLPLAVLLLLAGGLVGTAVYPKEVNYYENRSANRLTLPTAETWLNSSFQDQTEAALNDQIPLAETMKKGYNLLSGKLIYAMLRPMIETYTDSYIRFKNMMLFRDYIAFDFRTHTFWEESFAAKAANYNAFVAAHPELDFYLYYVEKDTDVDFRTDTPCGAWEYLEEQLRFPTGHTGCFSVDDFATFANYFYRTDHHWNYKGSYQGYRQVATMLGVPEEELITPEETVDTGCSFCGSKASFSGAEHLFSEPFVAYRFAYPEMKVTICGTPAQDYGAQDAFLAGTLAYVSYGSVYGDDLSEVIFDTGNTDRENILVLGESYDNAILKLLASHFNRTYSVDLRHYERTMGQPFSFSDYVEAHQITQVLLVGAMGYYLMPEFMLED